MGRRTSFDVQFFFLCQRILFGLCYMKFAYRWWRRFSSTWTQSTFYLSYALHWFSTRPNNFQLNEMFFWFSVDLFIHQIFFFFLSSWFSLEIFHSEFTVLWFVFLIIFSSFSIELNLFEFIRIHQIHWYFLTKRLWTLNKLEYK